METFETSRVVRAPIDDTFAWLTTTTNYRRSPLVLRCRLAQPGDGAPYGTGAVRIHTWLIGWFRERITGYDAPHSTDYVVERSFPPSRHEFGRMTFTEVDGGTLVEWTTRVGLPIPIVGGLLTRRVAKPIVLRCFRSILAAADAALAAPRS